VQSSPFPPCAARRRGGPGGKWGTPDPRARSRSPRPSRPHVRKSRSQQDAKPTSRSQTRSLTSRRRSQVLERNPRVTDHGHF
jgi:hypothetical protein